MAAFVQAIGLFSGPPDGTSRTSGPLFLAIRRPVPARRPAPRDICPHTGRTRLGYDRARVLPKKYTAVGNDDGLELHQLRYFAATHLGDQKVPLQLIMAKTRHKTPRTAGRYVRPGDAAIAEVAAPQRGSAAGPVLRPERGDIFLVPAARDSESLAG